MSRKKEAADLTPATIPVESPPIDQADLDTLQLALGPDWRAVLSKGKNPSAVAAELRRHDAEQYSKWSKAQSLMVGAQGDFGNFEEPRQMQLASAEHFMSEFKVGDPIETALGLQMLAMHCAAIECSHRAMIKDQHVESRKYNLSAANKSSRTFVTLLEALNRHRGKGGQQKVEVKHVHVHEGGQAIVGHVENHAPGGAGVQRKSEIQPHAPAANMRSEDAERLALSVIADDQWPLPNAWGQVAGSAEGQSEPPCARPLHGGEQGSASRDAGDAPRKS